MSPTTGQEPRLETERLVLRMWRDDDVERLYDAQSRPEVMQWLSDDFDAPEVLTSLEEARERVARNRRRSQTPPLVYLAIEPRGSGAAAGAVLLQVLPNATDGEVEIGWWLHPDEVGHGYATEAASAVLEHGFAAGLPEVFAIMWPDNAPSASVARRLGMTELGLVEDRWYPGPSRLFSLSAGQWAQDRAQRGA